MHLTCLRIVHAFSLMKVFHCIHKTQFTHLSCCCVFGSFFSKMTNNIAMNICVCVCVYAWVSSLRARPHTIMSQFFQIHLFLWMCMHVFVYKYIYAYINVYLCVCIYTYITYKYAHTIYTYISLGLLLWRTIIKTAKVFYIFNILHTRPLSNICKQNPCLAKVFQLSLLHAVIKS